MKQFLSILIIIASCLNSLGQDAFISITSEETNEAIEFAHIVYKDLATGETQLNTTKINGNAPNIAKHKSFITISFVGFEPKSDTIYPNKNYSYNLNSGDYNLEEIVVTGQYAPISESNSIYKVKVINQDYITSRGAISLPQVLNSQLNLRLQEDGVLGSSINIQGLGGENVKILIDGVPVVGRLNGSVDLSQINMSNVERIEVIEGPLSVLYGSNALAGTINVITKNPESQTTTGSVTGQYESVGLTNISASVSTADKKNSLLLEGGRNFFNGWSEFDTTRSKQWNQKEQYFGQAKYKYNFDKLTVGYSFNGLWEQIKDRGERLGEHSNNAFDDWYTTERYINSLDFKFKAGVFSNASILASYTYYRRLNTTYLRDLVNLSQSQVSEDTTFVHNVMSRGSFATQGEANWNFQIGYDFNYETSKTERISEETVDMGDYAVFGSLMWTPMDRLSIQPGLRYAYNTTFNSPLVPSLNLKYDLNERTKLRVSYAQGFRAPSIKELYLDFVDQNHMIFGNENLIPENSKNVNASIAWHTSFNSTKQSFKVEPSVFYNFIKDRIQLVKTGTSNREFTYQNIAEYTTLGGKIDLRYSIHPDFTFNLGYSHLGYSNIWHNEDGTLPTFLYTPEASASFSYWRASKKFNFNIIYKYTGETPDYRLNDSGNLVQTILPSYSWMDITVTQLFWQNRIEISAGGKNLFDVTSLNFSNGGGGGVHAGSGTNIISWGRTWFLKCKINI